MNGLTVKTVDFMGDGLLAAKDNDGIIWTGLNSFCRGIGLSKNERDRQVKNVQTDEVLKLGCVKFDAGVFETNNETLALQLDYVPLWLAKISITPSMKENNPELVDRLVKYQLKAKDVLAEAFLPQAHNVKQLTIDSREIAKITGKMHCSVMKEIECCMLTMQGMGFIDEEFFQKASYIGANNQWNTMYKCTEQGCEWFSRQLEPEKRKSFLEEITDSFERMRNVLDGKPVKKMPKAVCPADVPDKQPLIRLYKNNAWGILLADNEVYILNPGDIETLSRFIIKHIQKKRYRTCQHIF